MKIGDTVTLARYYVVGGKQTQPGTVSAVGPTWLIVKFGNGREVTFSRETGFSRGGQSWIVEVGHD